MKKTFLTSMISLSIFNYLIAQEPADALRYSWLSPSGSARQQAIGGAMGSLGGDISSAHVNPAGIAFFKNPELVITPGFLLKKNKSSYLGNTTANSKNSFNYGTSGIIFSNPGSEYRPDKKNTTVSITINKMADFNSHITYRAANNQSSYSQKFLEEIRNKKKNVLVIDDLDRIDPEHIFRILNILSVHNNHFDSENKFSFDGHCGIHPFRMRGE